MQVRVGGRWLDELGPWGDLAFNIAADGGCDKASWSVGAAEALRFPATRRGQPVQISVFGWPMWTGYVAESDHTELTMHAVGLAKQAEDAVCLGGAVSSPGADLTTNPHLAVTAAIARGKLSWTYRGNLPDVPFTQAGDTRTFRYIAELLDAVAAEKGMRWGVNGRGEFYMGADPTTPTWLLDEAPVAGAADDQYVTHLFGRHMTGDVAPNPEFAIVMAADPKAAGLWVRSERLVDATTAQWSPTRIQDAVRDMLAQVGGRLVHAGAYEATEANLSTVNGGTAAPHLVEPRQMVRMTDTIDAAGVLQIGAFHDFVIGDVAYRSGQPVVLTPVNTANRDLESVLSAPEAAPDEPWRDLL